MHSIKALAALVVLAAAASVAFASVFVYYPVTVNVSGTPPPVLFSEGSNANGPDIAGNTIGVSIGPKNTSITLTVHPTYQTTYYRNVTIINNTDTSNAYYVYVRVSNALSAGVYSEAKLIIQTGSNSFEVDLTRTVTTRIGLIPAGGEWEVDLRFVIPEDQSLPSSDSASIQLIYSPSDETPP